MDKMMIMMMTTATAMMTTTETFEAYTVFSIGFSFLGKEGDSYIFRINYWREYL
jgi:hypothetical protein